jgi:hypothetical protein
MFNQTLCKLAETEPVLIGNLSLSEKVFGSASWNKASLKKLMFDQLVKEYHRFYGRGTQVSGARSPGV